MSSHDDDPAAPATAKLGQAVAVLAGTAEAFAQLAGVTWLHPSREGARDRQRGGAFVEQP